MDEVDDYALLRAWREGDAQAGEQLFRRQFGTVYRFFQNKVSRDVDDLVQDVLMSLLKSPHAFEQRGSFKAYVLGIARFQLYDYYRRNKRDGERLEFETVTLFDLDPSPSVCVAERSEEQLLLQALRHLPVNLQIALELTYWEDLPAPEIAQVLDIPTDTVYSRLRRGKELLKKQLERLALSQAQLASTQTDLQAWAHAIRGRVRAPERSGDQIQTLSEPTSKPDGS